jgi:hypothetical protein
VQHLQQGKREPPHLTAYHFLVEVYQQVSLIPTHDASIGSLLFTLPLNPSPLTVFLLADRDTLSQQLHTLRLLATHVPVGYGGQNIRLNPHLLGTFQQLNKQLFRSHHTVLGGLELSVMRPSLSTMLMYQGAIGRGGNMR